MMRSRVHLPPAVRPPYTVFLNGIEQTRGVDYEVVDGVLEFPGELRKETKLSVWRWFWGIWGVGTYGKNDQVDVAWQVGGQPRIAHALDIEPVGGAEDRGSDGDARAPRHHRPQGGEDGARRG